MKTNWECHVVEGPIFAFEERIRTRAPAGWQPISLRSAGAWRLPGLVRRPRTKAPARATVDPVAERPTGHSRHDRARGERAG